MPLIGGSLSGLYSHHHGRRLNESECVYDNLSFDRLDWVNDDSNGAGGQVLKCLLGLNIDG
jgi:hypothetical protein